MRSHRNSPNAARYLHVQHLPQARRGKTGPSVGERLQKAYEMVMAGTRTR